MRLRADIANEMEELCIDPGIESAWTLPSVFYTEEEYLRRSMESIFARSWQYVCPRSRIKNIRPHMLLEGLLDEPIVLTVDDDGQLRCLSNVCTHRAMLVAEESCLADGLRCRYHGRTFGLDGRFVSMPGFEGVTGFPSETDDLKEIACDEWNGFAFCSLGPAAPLKEYLGSLEEILDGFPFQKLRPVAASDYLVEAHWALYCENYLEGLHIPFVHKGLNRELDPESYATDLFRYSSVQIARTREPNRRDNSSIRCFGGGIAAYYFYMFPNLMLNFYPWGLSLNLVKPLGVARTLVSYQTFVAVDSARGKGAGSDLGRVEFEDQLIVESVQKGIRSRHYNKGRYSPKHERGTHHFHRLIAECLTGGSG